MRASRSGRPTVRVYDREGRRYHAPMSDALREELSTRSRRLSGPGGGARTSFGAAREAFPPGFGGRGGAGGSDDAPPASGSAADLEIVLPMR